MLAVRQESVMVARVELHVMRQNQDESVRSFGARVKGQASICKQVVPCPNCEHEVSYSNEVIKDVIVRGINDDEIRLDILSDKNREMSLEEVVSFIEAKESGKRSANKLQQNSHIASSSRSQYQKAKSRTVNQAPEGPCSYCGKNGHGKNSSLAVRKRQCPAYGKTCAHCGLKNHFINVCRIKAQGLSPIHCHMNILPFSLVTTSGRLAYMNAKLDVATFTGS